MSRVWDVSKAEGGGLLLMLAIADHCHDDGTGAWPSIDALSKKTRLCERHVHRLISELETLGELQVKKGGGRSKHNEYSIVLKGDILSKETLTSCPKEGVERVTSCPETLTPCPERVTFATTAYKGTVLEPSYNRPPGERVFADPAPEAERGGGVGTVVGQIAFLIRELGAFYGHKPNRPPEHIEEEGALAVVKRSDWKVELENVRAWHNRLKPEERQYFPQKLSTLLQDWPGALDRAHRAKQATPPVKKFGVKGY